MAGVRRTSCLVALVALAPILATAAEAQICPVAVELYGGVSGVNRESFSKIKALLETPRYHRLKIETYRWGIEGEKTWCISNVENQQELFNELRAIVTNAESPREATPGIFSNLDLKRTPGGGAIFAYQGLTPRQP
jgi:hypothetical protein